MRTKRTATLALGIGFVALAACGHKDDGKPPVAAAPRDAGAMLMTEGGSVGIATIAITPTAMLLDGASVLELQDGAVPAKELAGGADSLTITPLALAAKHHADAGEHPVIQLKLDPTIGYKTLMQTVFSARTLGTEYVLRLAGTELTVPFALRPSRPPPAGLDDPTVAGDQELGMVALVSSKQLVLWSMSGRAGTLAQPYAVFPLSPEGRIDLAAVQRSVTTLVTPPGPAAGLAVADRPLTVICDGGIQAQVLLPILAAMQRGPNDQPLFVELQFSTGME